MNLSGIEPHIERMDRVEQENQIAQSPTRSEKSVAGPFSPIRKFFNNIGNRQRSEPRIPKDGDVSRRFFMKKMGQAAVGLGFTNFTGDLPFPTLPKELSSRENIDSVSEHLLELDAQMLPTADEFVASRSEFFDIFATYFSNQLKQKQYMFVKQVLHTALRKDDLFSSLEVAFTSNQRTKILEQKNTILSLLESNIKDPGDADSFVREVLDQLYAHPQSFAQILYDVYDIEAQFQKTPRVDQQICFRCKPQYENFIHPIGYFQERFDYRPSRPLERYEPNDIVEPVEVLPEIQECIEKAHEVFGVPIASITAILVMEGGGGVNGPGSTLDTKVQQEIINNNFNMPSWLHLRHPDTGAAGPGQIMQGTLDTFGHAVELLWPGENPANVDNIKHAIATIAAKLYVDALVLFYAERFRYTKQYLSERDRQINEFYSLVTNGLHVASDSSGLQRLLSDFGPLNEKDGVFTYHASIDYYGSDAKQLRLGNRSYDEFIAAYNHGIERHRIRGNKKEHTQ